jgi:hypothetical protein
MIESVLKHGEMVRTTRWGYKGCGTFNKRYMHSALKARVWRELRVKYRLCLGLDGARGI